MKNTILNNAINGRKVIAFVNGQNAPKTKTSNLYKSIIMSGYTPEDIGTKIDIAVGARRQNISMGYKMAIVQI